MKSAADLFSNLNVAIAQSKVCEYPIIAPFHPSQQYPEYPFQEIQPGNEVYETVRNALILLGLDKKNEGSAQWNPLGKLIKPGDKVVLKPNFVLSRHNNSGDLFSIITHPSVLRAIADYVFIALAGKGKIIIADAPQMDCDFQELLEKTKIDKVAELFKKEKKILFEIIDLRNFWLDNRAKPGEAFSSNRYNLPGDPAGSVLVDLGKKSLFYGQKGEQNIYGADYDRNETIKHHNGEIQEYLVSKTILDADVVISVPKLKVHKKVGVTLNIKGLVGINVNKNYLVHYKLGTPQEGGDQFPDGLLDKNEARLIKLQRWAFDKFLSKQNSFGDLLYTIAKVVGKRTIKILGVQNPSKEKKMLDAGNWHGNDSAWRMSVDLFTIITFVDAAGKLHGKPVRRLFSFIDGIVGGENDGPLLPDSKPSGVIVAGSNFVAVDIVASRYMGFDYKKIKSLYYILENVKEESSELEKSVFDNFVSTVKGEFKKHLDYKPHPGWIGHIEI